MKHGRLAKSALAACGLVSALVLGDPSAAFAQPTITTAEIADGVYLVNTVPMPPYNMNNLVLVGPETVTLLDTAATAKTGQAPFIYSLLSAAIHGATDGRPVNTIVNTHWHYDHVGLVKLFKDLEGTDRVIGHWRSADYLLEEHCMSDGFDCSLPASWTPAFPGAVPTEVVHGEANLVLDSDVLRIKTVENAHSGADLFVILARANVAYTGDIYFGGVYPAIDRPEGGTVNGMIASLHQLLAQINDDTIVVPSHGTIGTRQSVVAFVDMLDTCRKQVRALIDLGLTEQQVMFHPSFAALDAQWGGGFVPGYAFRLVLYRDLVSQD